MNFVMDSALKASSMSMQGIIALWPLCPVRFMTMMGVLYSIKRKQFMSDTPLS